LINLSIIIQASKKDIKEDDIWILEDDILSKSLEIRFNAQWKIISNQYTKDLKIKLQDEQKKFVSHIYI
jgi:hypothetical protein